MKSQRKSMIRLQFLLEHGPRFERPAGFRQEGLCSDFAWEW
jgi:hypothetical protein